MTRQKKAELLALSVNSPRLLNITDLSTILHVDRQFIRAMKIEGYIMPGGRNTIKSALDWLQSNPDFKPTKAIKRPKAHRQAI